VVAAAVCAAIWSGDANPLAWSFGADGHAIWYAQRDGVAYRVTA
jgi:hypothetical protein